jgi:hypothetical protein
VGVSQTFRCQGHKNEDSEKLILGAEIANWYVITTKKKVKWSDISVFFTTLGMGAGAL